MTQLLVALGLTMLVGQRLDLQRQVEVRIEGYLGATQAEVNPWKEFQVRVGEGELRPFALTNVIMLSAGKVSGADIVAQAEPIRPNFIFAGDAAQLEPIKSAQPNELLKITGYTSIGSQWVLVNRVERSEPITGPTPTPSWTQKLFGF